MNIEVLKRRTIIASIIILLVSAVIWVARHSFIEINVINPTKGSSFFYKLINQASGKEVAVNSSSAHIKKIAASSSYETIVSSGDTNNFKVIKTKGWLRKTSVQVTLRPESKREFVGNQAGGCINLINGSFVSYSCGGLYSDMELQIPATDSQPSYKIKNSIKGLSGTVEGVYKEKNGNSLALIRVIPSIEGQKVAHILYTINESLQLSQPIVLGDLNPNIKYSLEPHADGFVVYSEDIKEVKFYASPSAQPVNIAVRPADSDKLAPLSIDVGETNLSIVYGNNEDIKSKTQKTTVWQASYDSPSKTSSFTLNNNFSKGLSCSDKYFCLISDKTLSAYSVNSSKPELMFKVVNVKAIDSIHNRTIVVKPEGILMLSPAKGDGYIDFSFQDYTFSGLVTEQSNYMVMLSGLKGFNGVVYVSQGARNNDSIDKSVLDLLKLREVLFISANHEFIYVTPDLGNPVLDKNNEGFIYDPQKRKQANDKINTAANTLHLGEQGYRVINTIP